MSCYLRAIAKAYSATTVFPAEVWAATSTECPATRHGVYYNLTLQTATHEDSDFQGTDSQLANAEGFVLPKE